MLGTAWADSAKGLRPALTGARFARFERPQEAGGRRVLFVSGDDAAAKRTGSVLLDELGFAAIDLGSLRDAGAIQQAGGPLAGRTSSCCWR